MEVIKILLTLLLILLKLFIAAFFGYLTAAFASGVSWPIPVDIPNPTAYRVFRWFFMSALTLLYTVSAIWLVRSAWLNLRFSKLPTEPLEQLKLEGAINLISRPNERNSLDLSRLTEAGWLLGFSSIGISVVVFDVIAENMKLRGGPPKDLGFAVLIAAAVIAVFGYWLLSTLGFTVITRLPQNTLEDLNSDESNHH